jgi:precorrin-3B synthase
MSAVAVEIKGWCPGARRPMQSGDGLIVRVRPHGGSLPVAALAQLAVAAARFGNGQIDLTRRANLQIRGVAPETLAPLWDLLRSLDLLDDSAETEAIRNIAINPLAGLDPTEISDLRQVGRALEALLGTDQALRALPGKFAFAIDGGGLLPLTELDADIRLGACRADAEILIAIGLSAANGVEWLGMTSQTEAAATAMRLARAVLAHSVSGRAQALSLEAVAAVRADLGLRAMLHLMINSGDAPSPRRGLITLSNGDTAVGLGAAFGRLDSETLGTLARELSRLGVAEVRMSPWRTLYAATPNRAAGETLVATAREIGLIVDDTDPMVRIDACSGVGCCNATSLATRDHARALAAIAGRGGFTGTVHVSGCAKGCARSAAADLVLVGAGDKYGVIRNGTVRDDALFEIDPAEIATRGYDLLNNDRTAHV